jgi:hypothetical protein
MQPSVDKTVVNLTEWTKANVPARAPATANVEGDVSENAKITANM